MWFRFLVSFVVDARGGAMRGLRHSGVRIIVPPGRICEPTRVTCKLVRVEKVDSPPPLNEGEALASRILKMGPVGAKFTGSVRLINAIFCICYFVICISLPLFSLQHFANKLVIRQTNRRAKRKHNKSISNVQHYSPLIVLPFCWTKFIITRRHLIVVVVVV